MNTALFVFCFIALSLYAISTVTQKLVAKYLIAKPLIFNFYTTLFSFLFIIPILLSGQLTFPNYFTNVFLSSIFGTLGGLFYAFALSEIDASVIGPMYNFRTVFSVLLSILFLKEILPWPCYFWISLIVIGGFIVTINEKMNFKSFFKKPVLFMLLYILGISLMSIFNNKAINEVGYWTFTFWSKLISLSLVCLTIPLFHKDLFIKQKHLDAMTFITFIYFLAGLAANKAYSLNVSIATTIISLPGSMFLIFFLSRFKPQLLENHPLKIYFIRFGAAAIMFYSALQLVLK